MEKVYKVVFRYEHVPFRAREDMMARYMKNRNETEDVIDALIDSISDELDESCKRLEYLIGVYGNIIEGPKEKRICKINIGLEEVEL